MKQYEHFDPECTSAPMVDRCGTRMVVGYNVKHGWQLEHFDIHSAFFHDDYVYHTPMYILEIARANGIHKHGNTIDILVRNQYENPSGTYYDIYGLLSYVKRHGAVRN